MTFSKKDKENQFQYLIANFTIYIKNNLDILDFYFVGMIVARYKRKKLVLCGQKYNIIKKKIAGRSSSGLGLEARRPD